MTLTRRLIVCLDVSGGRVVKGVQFTGLRDVGDPAELAARYEREGADEIVFLDIAASHEERRTLLDLARRAAECVFIPLTIGGGIGSVDDIGEALRAGADKVSLNSAAVRDPAILTAGARKFGSQCIVASIDAKREDGTWRVYTKGGRHRTALEAVAWSRECVGRGAGEILLTSIDRDGGRSGYDLELTHAVASAVPVPVIASGGAGRAQDLCDVLAGGGDAALVAGLLHDGVATIVELKRAMRDAGIPTRMAAA